MRKLISTFFVCVMLVTALKSQTIFDPATYAGTLKPGMEVVSINGTSYLAVPLDGWNSLIDVPAFTIPDGMGIACKVKYAKGATDTIQNLAKINAVVQLMDTVNKIDNPWGEGLVPSSTTLIQNPPVTSGFSRVTGNFTEDMKIVHQVQFFAQEQYTWGPITGDTMWISEIYLIDPHVLFDPARVDTSTLPDGYEVVDEGGTKLLKVTVNGWNSTLDIDPFSMGDNNRWSFDAKMEAGTAGLTIDQMNTFVQGMVGGSGSFSIGAASSATLKTYEGDAKPNVTVSGLQFAAQKNFDDWAAQVGAILYVGKITVSYSEPQAVAPSNTYNVTYVPAEEYIDIDGSVLPDEFWSDVPVANVDRQALPKDLTPVITDSKGTMKVAWDEYYLYVLVEAEDATPITSPGSSTPWLNDGTEIFIDMLDRRFKDQKRIEGEQHQVRFNLGRTDADTSHVMYPGVVELVTFAMVTGGNGWKLEVQFPWANLYNGITEAADIPKMVSDSIKHGKKVGWEVSVINANVLDTRNSIMNWANNEHDDMAYNTNEFWGQLTLIGGADNISSQELSEIRLYPNPANNMIYLHGNQIETYKIIDITGKTVTGGVYKYNGIDITNLQNGVYFLSVTSKFNQVTIHRFVKN